MKRHATSIFIMIVFCVASVFCLVPVLSYAGAAGAAESYLLTVQMKNLESGDEVSLLVPADVVVESSAIKLQSAEDLTLLSQDGNEDDKQLLLATFKKHCADSTSTILSDPDVTNGFKGDFDVSTRQWTYFSVYGANASDDIVSVDGKPYFVASLISAVEPFVISTYHNDPSFAEEILLMVKDRNDKYAIVDFSNVNSDLGDAVRHQEVKTEINRAKLAFESVEDGTDMISQPAPVIGFDLALGIAQIVLIVITFVAVIVVLVIGIRKPKQT